MDWLTPESRIAADGAAYAYLDFVEWYGDRAYWKWCESPVATEHSTGDTSVVATEHSTGDMSIVATEPPRTSSQLPQALSSGCWTYEDAMAIPQIDRMGKKRAYGILQMIPVGPLPITEAAPFQWWLFGGNLGISTREVIGLGIIEARLEDNRGNNVQLLFTRSDMTHARLAITHPPNGSCSTRIMAIF